MTRRAVVVVVALTALVIGAAVGVTHAAFSSAVDTADNSFSADTSFDGVRMATGSYTGNGADNRAFTAPNFRPDIVIVKATSAEIGVIRTSTMSGDASKLLSGATALVTDHVQSLDPAGFTLGANARVNGSGTTYTWTAIKADGESVKVGSYSGIGAALSITSLGFSPTFVSVLGAGAQTPILRMNGMTRSFAYDTGTGSTTQITSLLSTGFSLGLDAAVNLSGTTYHYIAFDDVSGLSRVATYTGNGANNRSITGTGFEPDFVLVRASDTATSRSGRQRPAASTGQSSQGFNASADITTGIRALQSNGFQVGTDGSVNANGRTYMYLALKDVDS